MRAPIALVFSLLLVTFAGCVDENGNPLGFSDDLGAPARLGPAENATMSAAPDAPSAAASPTPRVTSIATTPFTAPLEIAVDRVSEAHATMTLFAGPDGLRCVAQPSQPLTTPAGFKTVATTAACSLLAGNSTFATASTDSLLANFSMMQDVPVESFAWAMVLTRTLENNTGEHDETLYEFSRAQQLAPRVEIGHFEDGEEDWLFYDRYEVCDGGFGFELEYPGIATIVFQATAYNGRAILEIDLSDYAVIAVEEYASQANATNPFSVTFDGRSVHGSGPWAHESTVQTAVTIDFEGRREYNSILAPDECPAAIWHSLQEIPASASSSGIAAGWADTATATVPISVWLTGL